MRAQHELSYHLLWLSWLTINLELLEGHVEHVQPPAGLPLPRRHHLPPHQHSRGTRQSK